MLSYTSAQAFCPQAVHSVGPFAAVSAHSASVCHPLRTGTRRALTSPKRRPRSFFHATLNPPNNDVDWVYVDISFKNVPSQNTERLEAEIHDDAKSLVRVALRDAAAELSVLLCSDDDIRGMNSKWRGMDESTDVLSFPQDDPDKVVLGDVVVSVDTAARQAEERGHALRDEIRILLVHGLLHLLGYDHEGAIEGDWLVMAQMENRFLKQLEWVGEGLVSVAQDPTYRDIVQS